MKVKSSKTRSKPESLRIQVLRKSVSLKDFKLKRKPIVIELSSDEGKQKLKNALAQSRKAEQALQVPKSPAKRTEENENRITDRKISLSLFNFNLFSANFARKFGIERKVIEPAKKKEMSTGMKKGKSGKLLYM